MTPYEQREALKRLKDVVLISKRGLPAKNYYKIDFDSLITSCENFTHKKLNNLTTSGQNFSQQEVKNFNITNKRILIKDTNKTFTTTSEQDYLPLKEKKNKNNYISGRADYSVSNPVDPIQSDLEF